MAHNAFIHGGPADPTAWLTGYVITQLDLQTIDLRQFQAINGDLGGTWAPAAVITIGGVGLTVTTTFTGSGTNTLSGPTTTGTLAVHGQGTYWNKQTFDGANSGEAYFSSGALLTGLAGAVGSWSGLWTFNDDVTFNDPAVFNDNFQHLAGIAIFASTLNIGGTTSITAGSFGIQAGVAFNVGANIVLGAAAGIQVRYLIGPNTDLTIAANTYDRIRVTTLSANRTYSLAAAPNGSECIITMSSAAGSGANQCRINNEAAVQLIVLQNTTVGVPDTAHFIVRSGSWEVFDFRPYAVT